VSTPVIIRSSPKKARTPQRRSLALRAAITVVASEYDRLSIRQLFYQLVARGVIDKTDRAYKRVCDASAQMRLSGELDYRKVVDGHRSRRAVFAHDGIRDALADAHALYRRDYWRSQPQAVEVWCEKDARTGVVQPVCDRYGVTYVATRGFPSMTLRYESAQTLGDIGKPATIFYFGDHDASGRQISDNLEVELRQHGAQVTVERVALNPDHIAAYTLPVRAGKGSDSRQAAFAARYGDKVWRCGSRARRAPPKRADGDGRGLHPIGDRRSNVAPGGRRGSVGAAAPRIPAVAQSPTGRSLCRDRRRPMTVSTAVMLVEVWRAPSVTRYER